jgi:hypothetical protein
MYERLCKDAKCSKLGEAGCTIFTLGGVLFRMRQGYCAVPDFPKRERVEGVVRVGQKKQKKKK